MSLFSIRKAKKLGMKTILERGSSHILYQDEMLHTEYKKFNIDFHIHSKVIAKELQEYEEADFITVPSNFVRDSFIEKGVDPDKLFLNNFGASSYFKPTFLISEPHPFRILYMGTLSIRKGLIYLFEALEKINIPKSQIEVWFIGSIDKELSVIIESKKQSNWTFKGHVNHYELQKFIIQCDVAIHPSIEEGLSMVIPQIMACGVPVIATTNTGGSDIIENDVNGMIVPIRSADAIATKIDILYNNPAKLAAMKLAASKITSAGITWDNYGKIYTQFINKIINN